MMLIPTYIAPSPIEGVGVFAEAPIAKGTLIWQLVPEADRLIRRGDVETFPPHFQNFIERYSYPYPHDPELLIVELDNGRFMNHCDQPNTRFSDPDAGFALRDIEAGEELTCNYSEFDAGFELLPGRRFAA